MTWVTEFKIIDDLVCGDLPDLFVVQVTGCVTQGTSSMIVNADYKMINRTLIVILWSNSQIHSTRAALPTCLARSYVLGSPWSELCDLVQKALSWKNA